MLRRATEPSVGPGAQLVHLDIKSANVLLQDATFAVAKLADLGVSKYLVQGSLLNLTRIAGALARQLRLVAAPHVA